MGENKKKCLAGCLAVVTFGLQIKKTPAAANVAIKMKVLDFKGYILLTLFLNNIEDNCFHSELSQHSTKRPRLRHKAQLSAIADSDGTTEGDIKLLSQAVCTVIFHLVLRQDY